MTATRRLLPGLGLASLLVLALSPTAARQVKFEEFKRAQLVIDDIHYTAWMTIENTFNTEAQDLWEGVLIQVGDYRDEHGAATELFGSIVFERNGTALHTLTRGNFRWVNIVAADDPTRGAPMEPAHVALLYPDPNVESRCDVFDDRAYLGCGCDDPLCCVQPVPDPIPFQPCLRLRSLHGFFRPFAVITYWQGGEGYDIAVEPRPNHGESRITFSFKDPVQISVDGRPLKDLIQDPLKGAGIDTISVNLSQKGPTHGGKHDPGM